ncbi:MAG: hypothetical protein AAF708_13915 [Deinococcota bacterium]
MRAANFRLEWVMLGHIVGLRHPEPTVSLTDVQAIAAAGQAMLDEATNDTHLIIDNRNVPMQGLPPLAQLQAGTPVLSHPRLRQIVSIKPQTLEVDVPALTPEMQDNVQLTYVSSLAEAVSMLQISFPDLPWQTFNQQFFE